MDKERHYSVNDQVPHTKEALQEPKGPDGIKSGLFLGGQLFSPDEVNLLALKLGIYPRPENINKPK